jgi:putative oxidoreductase
MNAVSPRDLIRRIAAIPILLQKGFWAMAHEARTDFAMLLGCLFLALVGAGAYSLDARVAHLRARSRSG